MATLVPIQKEFGFGLLTIGCSPGGGGSNIWTLLLGGDINLSMVMTFISSVTALESSTNIFSVRQLKDP
ncbi:unnamed protein product [Protopolystoma xenopodis]|uniref:Uncharacterized protein n=1 Tax=Protopolystoma xenopodis TaxID=117903 RepID=A0A3S5BBB4_9PLAT|nr:unnamed protein product [Protopolystoma xenopodis]